MAEPTMFPEQNRVWAEDQPEYKPLPTWTDEHETISCWRLSWRERLTALVFGKVWLRQLNFGRPLQPITVGTEYPFAPTEEQER